jgi:hypothetical protein
MASKRQEVPRRCEIRHIDRWPAEGVDALRDFLQALGETHAQNITVRPVPDRGTLIEWTGGLPPRHARVAYWGRIVERFGEPPTRRMPTIAGGGPETMRRRENARRTSRKG